MTVEVGDITARYGREVQRLQAAVRLALQRHGGGRGAAGQPAGRESEREAEEQQGALLALLDPIFAVDKELQEVLRRINETHALVERRAALAEEVRCAEARLEALAEETFDRIVAQRALVARERGALETLAFIGESGGVPLEAVAALSEWLALTGGPPPRWKVGDALHLHRPPYPTEDLMRASLLFQVMNAGVAPPAASPPMDDATAARHSPPPQQGAPERRTRKPAQMLDLDLNPDLV